MLNSICLSLVGKSDGGETDPTLLRYASPITEENVGSCLLSRLIGFKLCPTTFN